MLTLKTQLESLTEKMTEQTCYKKYLEVLKTIQSDEELYARLNEYRKKNVELHWKKQGLEEESKLERQYHDLVHEDLIHEFLYWEQETLKMVRMIHRQVDEALILDYSFLS